MVLASEQQIAQEDATGAWAVLDQLFAIDPVGQSIELGLRDTLLGKVLSKARLKRGMPIQVPITQQMRDQAMHAAAGGYPAHMLANPPVTSPTNLGQTTAFQSTGNIFEDWDALMQESGWPSGFPGTDNNYWV